MTVSTESVVGNRTGDANGWATAVIGEAVVTVGNGTAASAGAVAVTSIGGNRAGVVVTDWPVIVQPTADTRNRTSISGRRKGRRCIG
jgi:hypothetical protein